MTTLGEKLKGINVDGQFQIIGKGESTGPVYTVTKLPTDEVPVIRAFPNVLKPKVCTFNADTELPKGTVVKVI